MKPREYLMLAVALILPQLAGGIGSLFTTPAIPGWYAALEKPVLNPPAFVFAPVWTTLFVLMGIAAFLVWRKGLKTPFVRAGLLVFVLQLVLNTLWSVLFFGLQDPGAALVEIGLLWLAILVNIILFARVSKTAAWLLVPYLAWVSFASYLNWSIVGLN